MELAMIGKWTFWIAALALAAGLQTTAISRADTPWSNLLGINHVEADKNKTYTLTQEQGPWIIMACSFNGPHAEQQAHDLVLELRKKYWMEAFVHRMNFKLDDPNGNAQPMYASPYRREYQMVAENPGAFRDGAIKEIAVVVGNFPAINDPEARKVLQKLKAADPECFRAIPEEAQSRSLALMRSLQAGVKDKDLPQGVEGRKETGPLAHAFITRNPLLSEDFFAPKNGVDDLVLKINKNVEHSLLDCPGKYSVQVATFTGEVIINQGEIQAIQKGLKAGPESTKQGLAAAAEKAHDLTKALRIKGWDAYEFHDHNASIVTVGSFESVGQPRPDGKIEINPQAYQIIETFRAKEVKGGSGALQPESLIGIFFDVQPILVEVPKRSISRQLAHQLDTAGR
jgi:hypothetical protein